MMTKRSVSLVGVLILMAMIGSSIIGAVSAIAASDTANGSFSVFLPLILNAIGAMAEVPQGAVMSFNLSSCPSGWTEVTAAQGRAIVGLPSGGTLNGTVGGGMSDLEDRSHTHDVNPMNTSTTSTGSHTHSVDPPNTASTSIGDHTHAVNPAQAWTSVYDHEHHIATFDGGNHKWYAYDSMWGYTEVVAYGDGMDTAGSGYFPLATELADGHTVLMTAEDSHTHSYDLGNTISTQAGSHSHGVDIPSITSTFSGGHSHSVDIATTSSSTASTSDIMPYIQFLVCEKD
ncbi:MAG: hypothetical protein E4G99_07410 [Anaerolineales bacterium]|nr:MAG: hypothetical protein E4G99_07410 [Anaerolineales bacterium]